MLPLNLPVQAVKPIAVAVHLRSDRLVGPWLRVAICSTERATALADKYDASNASIFSDHEFGGALDSASDSCLLLSAVRRQGTLPLL